MKGIWEGALGYCVDLPNVFSVSPVARAPRRAGNGRRRRERWKGGGDDYGFGLCTKNSERFLDGFCTSTPAHSVVNTGSA